MSRITECSVRHAVESYQIPSKPGQPHKNTFYKVVKYYIKLLCLIVNKFLESDINKWWPVSESNQGHSDFQSLALPTELTGHYVKKDL